MSTDSRFVHKIWNEAELSKMVEGGIPFPMFQSPAVLEPGEVTIGGGVMRMD